MSAGTDTIDRVQTALINAGVGQKTSSANDWMIYKWQMQDSDPASTKTIADRAICLYDTPGLPAEAGFQMDYPSIQVVVRSKPDDARAAREKMQDVFTALHGSEPALGVPPFVFFYAQQSAPLQMGIDERRRIRMSWNFRSMRNRPT